MKRGLFSVAEILMAEIVPTFTNIVAAVPQRLFSRQLDGLRSHETTEWLMRNSRSAAEPGCNHRASVAS